MLITYLLPIVIVFSLLIAWVSIQAASRSFARRHPEFTPASDSPGCAFCICRNGGTCPKSNFTPKQPKS